MNHTQRLELDKILNTVASYAVLEAGKARVLSLTPETELSASRRALDITGEATALLFTLGAGRVEYFPPLGDCLERAQKGATLTISEITDCALLLRSARVLYRSVRTFQSEELPLIRALTENLLFDEGLEESIDRKIEGDGLCDHASERLYSLRREIRMLGERIRARLEEYLQSEKRYLQDEVVTMRGDRYVLPVKVEYKRNIKGFIHDRSQSGATVFIEPEEVLELNNELRDLQIDEKEEEERILKELSSSLGAMKDALLRDIEILSETDSYYARAEYGYALRSTKPLLNNAGKIEIIKGRHPLLDQKTAVPVSVSVGEGYRFLLISGANTGGKTVTLKMCGLFCLMAACGLFVPAAEGTRLSVFDGVYCDVGDSQSIEENLSTFSSHILSLKEILNVVGEKSFVLIDEPGGGTDPEEGQAIAKSVLEELLNKGCRGIVTTHYSSLKEFAMQKADIENACMEFDSESLCPLYRLKIGVAGSSNALFICERLGLDRKITDRARAYLPDGARAFEALLRSAEESRIRAEEERVKTEEEKRAWQEKLHALEKEEAAFLKEKEKFLLTSKAEARKIILNRTVAAEEILAQIEEIFKKEQLTEADLIQARTLKNKMPRGDTDEEEAPLRLQPVDGKTLKAGDKIYIQSMGAEGEVISVKQGKNVCEVQCGTLRVQSKLSDLYYLPAKSKKEKHVQVVKNLSERRDIVMECNLIGLSAAEAIPEAEAFLDGALLQNLNEVRIVHGMGTGKLRAAVHAFLKNHKRVKEFRLGRYGEGESGVTIVTLK